MADSFIIMISLSINPHIIYCSACFYIIYTLYFFSYKTDFFFIPKPSKKSRFVLQDRSRSLGWFRKGKSSIIAKFHRTNLVIFSRSRERKSLSYSRINMVIFVFKHSVLNEIKC